MTWSLDLMLSVSNFLQLIRIEISQDMFLNISSGGLEIFCTANVRHISKQSNKMDNKTWTKQKYSYSAKKFQKPQPLFTKTEEVDWNESIQGVLSYQKSLQTHACRYRFLKYQNKSEC
ncbi:CLUMA_CG011419, isoform A [Clunio marinus]|uniref:CLUMA_CG011419, isoform A n=1 Tax=Clunio marinus TaxID=568069 RepID=A0A1J1IE53_9DIPT|nr:CLUMA_CG011419, isoform A [Clunio marinus]